MKNCLNLMSYACIFIWVLGVGLMVWTEIRVLGLIVSLSAILVFMVGLEVYKRKFVDIIK